MRLVHWLVTVPLALVVVVFAVSNRESVIVTFWPLPVDLAAPLYLVVLLALLVGFLFGELVAWINAGRTRREMRIRGRRIEALERELAANPAPTSGASTAVASRPRLPPPD